MNNPILEIMQMLYNNLYLQLLEALEVLPFFNMVYQNISIAQLLSSIIVTFIFFAVIFFPIMLVYYFIKRMRP